MLSRDRNRIVWCTPGVVDELALIDAVQADGWTIARHCVDAADTLAVVSIEPDSVAVVSTALQRVDAALWAELCERAAGVIVIRARGESGIPPSSPGAAHIEATSTALLGSLKVPGPATSSGIEGAGSVIAVWGTAGAPGRTTVTIALAEACSRLGFRTLMIDGDTHNPSITTTLAVTEQASGVLLACKHAEQGSLDGSAMERALRCVKPGLDVLTGLDDPGRWAELRGGPFRQVLRTCRTIADIAVVDIHSCIESTSDPVTGLRGERNAIARAALADVDQILIVARPDPVGVARLVRSLSVLDEVTRDRRPLVLVNRIRRSWQVKEVRQVLTRTGFVVDVEGIPEDSSVLKAAARGSLPSEMRGRSSSRTRMRHVAHHLTAA
jgi:Mrp family chromosome partitioning ATPase